MPARSAPTLICVKLYMHIPCKPLFILLLPLLAFPAAALDTVYLVRHAEKAAFWPTDRGLDAEGLLNYEKYRGLVLTASGEALARNITRRHQLLSDFLRLFGLDEETIYRDVEGMEHHISPPTLRAIEALTAQLKRRPKLLAGLNK